MAIKVLLRLSLPISCRVFTATDETGPSYMVDLDGNDRQGGTVLCFGGKSFLSRTLSSKRRNCRCMPVYVINVRDRIIGTQKCPLNI